MCKGNGALQIRELCGAMGDLSGVAVTVLCRTVNFDLEIILSLRGLVLMVGSEFLWQVPC